MGAACRGLGELIPHPARMGIVCLRERATGIEPA
jgi:hypothetical protein